MKTFLVICTLVICSVFGYSYNADEDIYHFKKEDSITLSGFKKTDHFKVCFRDLSLKCKKAGYIREGDYDILISCDGENWKLAKDETFHTEIEVLFQAFGMTIQNKFYIGREDKPLTDLTHALVEYFNDESDEIDDEDDEGNEPEEVMGYLTIPANQPITLACRIKTDLYEGSTGKITVQFPQETYLCITDELIYSVDGANWNSFLDRLDIAKCVFTKMEGSLLPLIQQLL